jgi:hypothetical protein
MMRAELDARSRAMSETRSDPAAMWDERYGREGYA